MLVITCDDNVINGENVGHRQIHFKLIDKMINYAASISSGLTRFSVVSRPEIGEPKFISSDDAIILASSISAICQTVAKDDERQCL